MPSPRSDGPRSEAPPTGVASPATDPPRGITGPAPRPGTADPPSPPGNHSEGDERWSGRRDDAEAVAGGAAGPQELPLGPTAGLQFGPTARLQLGPSDRVMVARAANERPLDEAIFGVTRVLTFAGARGLTSASGFLFERDGRLYLVTSRHVLFDGPSGHTPDRIEIDLHTDPGDLTRLATLSILLYQRGVAAWHQARDIGGEVDVATLELDRSRMPADCAMRAFGPQHLASGFDRFEVGARLAIPGFPLGFFDTLHHLPVVRQASIASYFGVRFQGLGFFLTDARMHRGSSGSPVLAPVDGAAADAPRWQLLGVHSSRMDMASRDAAQDESLGLNCAWYADVLMTLTAAR